MRLLLPYSLVLVLGASLPVAAQDHGAPAHEPAPAKTGAKKGTKEAGAGASHSPAQTGHGDAAAASSTHAAPAAPKSGVPAAAAHDGHAAVKSTTPATLPVAGGDGHGSPAPRPSTTKPEHGGAAPEASATPRHASSKELDAVLERISKRIAARSATGAARPAARRAPPADAAASQETHDAHPPAARVELEWRPSVTWPGDLKPVPPSVGDSRVGVDWPSSVE